MQVKEMVTAESVQAELDKIEETKLRTLKQIKAKAAKDRTAVYTKAKNDTKPYLALLACLKS